MHLHCRIGDTSHDKNNTVYLQRNYKNKKLFTRNTQDICFTSCFYNRAHGFASILWKKDIFPRIYSCNLLLRDMWNRIPYSTISQSQRADCSFTYAENSVVCSTDIRSTSRLIAQDNTPAIAKLSSVAR